MKLGVPKETLAGERRVALVPDTVAKLVKDGHTVVVEPGAGVAAGFTDEAFRTAGASLGDPWAADVVCKVQKPSPSEAAKPREGAALVGLFQAATNAELMGQLAKRRVTTFSLELLPRITRAQSMDVLSSQATAAGTRPSCWPPRRSRNSCRCW